MKFSNLQLTTPYLALTELFYDRVQATPLKTPYIISVSQEAAKLLGAGLTLYSRQGDGRAVLRSSIREYLCKLAPASAKNIKLSCSS